MNIDDNKAERHSDAVVTLHTLERIRTMEPAKDIVVSGRNLFEQWADHVIQEINDLRKKLRDTEICLETMKEEKVDVLRSHEKMRVELRETTKAFDEMKRRAEKLNVASMSNAYEYFRKDVVEKIKELANLVDTKNSPFDVTIQMAIDKIRSQLHQQAAKPVTKVEELLDIASRAPLDSMTRTKAIIDAVSMLNKQFEAASIHSES